MIKRIIFTILVVIFILSITTLSFADDTKELKEKADKQTESIFNIIKDKELNTSEKDYSGTLDAFNNIRKNSSDGFTSFKDIKVTIKDKIFLLCITSRKFAIALYMVTLMFSIFMASGLGAKNLKKRKSWIIFCFSISFIFLVFINIPLFIIYSESSAGENFNMNSIYNSLYDIIFFFRENSFTISATLAIYGILNLLLGKNDIPRRTVGKYLIKASMAVYIAMIGIPTIIKLII